MHFLHDFPLKSLNSFQIPAFASNYIQLTTLEDIKDLCASVDLEQSYFYILGGGTNTLFVSTLIDYVLHVKLSGIEIIGECQNQVSVKAAAGESWQDLVSFCVERDFGGIENLSLIPGTVGAAPVQNIGAYGCEVKDVLDCIETIDLITGEETSLKVSACGLGYRTSFFKTIWQRRHLVTSITLTLHKKKKFCLENESLKKMLERREVAHLTFKAVSEAVIAIRKQRLPDPKHLANAGSFFQNPIISKKRYGLLKGRYPAVSGHEVENETKVKISAGWLIESAGCKGLRMGDAGVYPFHALVLVNYGTATGQDILKLANIVRQKVSEQFGIVLQPEVNIVDLKSCMKQ